MAKGESAVVNMIVNMTENIEEIIVSGIVDASSNSLGLNQSTTCILHYSPMIYFSDVENKSIEAKKHGLVDILLYNVLDDAVSLEEVYVLVYEDSSSNGSYELGDLLANFTLVSDELGLIQVPIGLLLNGSQWKDLNGSQVEGFDLDNSSNGLNYLAGGNYVYIIHCESNDKYETSETRFNLTVNKIDTLFDAYLNNDSIASYIDNWNILYQDNDDLPIENIFSLSGDIFSSYLMDEYGNKIIDKSILVNDGKMNFT